MNPKASRAVLFCFHGSMAACEDRIQLLSRLNPGLPIYGLFAGDIDMLPAAQAPVGIPRDRIYVPGTRAPRWLWQNTDLTVREWFMRVGRRFPFDILHVVQWDLVFFEPLAVLYGHIPVDAVGLTGLVNLPDIQTRWHWTLDADSARQIRALEAWAHAAWGFRGPLRACLGPGYCLPRAFLERYCMTDVPELGHDEVRLPLFAHGLGFEMRDTRLYGSWFDPASELLFNANGEEIRLELIEVELRKVNGRRAFHPVWRPGTAALLSNPLGSAHPR